MGWPGAALAFRRYFRGPDVRRATRAERALADRYLGPHGVAVGAPGKVSVSEPVIDMGTVLGERVGGASFQLPVSRIIHGRHGLVLGDTGAGKTWTVGVLIDGLLRSGHRPIIILDAKLGQPDLADLVRDRLIPNFLLERSERERTKFLDELTVIDLAGRTHLPQLHLLARDPSRPAALQIAEQIAAFDATAGRNLGARGHAILSKLLALTLDRDLHWSSVPRILDDPALVEALVRESKDSDLRRYVFSRYPSEPMESKLALAARLDAFLAIPSVRLAMSARQGPRMERWLERGVTIVRLGGLGGLASTARFLGALLFSQLIAAMFARPIESRSPTALVFLDEWAAIAPALHEETEHVLLMARAKKTYFWFLTQLFGALDSSLAKVLRANTAQWVLLRTAIEDSKLLGGVLPVSGVRRRPRTAPWDPPARTVLLSAAEERDALIEGLSRIPDREGLWFDRRSGTEAVRFRTRELRLPEPETIPKELLQAVRTAGTVPVTELEAEHKREMEHLDALVCGGGESLAKAIRGRGRTTRSAGKSDPRLPQVG